MTVAQAGNRFVAVAGTLVLATALLLTSPTNAASTIEQQRELFRSVIEPVERGNWAAVSALAPAQRELLEDYVLWPDLRATWLRASINKVPASEIETFVEQYGTLRPARELRYRYALNFVRNDDFPGFLKIYERYYQGQDIAKLDCLALQAHIQAGRHQRVENLAIALWMVGKSQVKECDPVFEYLKDRKLLGVVEYRKRFELAVAARNFALAKWLGKKIDQQHVETASQWLMAQTNPEDFLRSMSSQPGSPELSKQLVYAVERLTYRDPEIARDLWQAIPNRHVFSAAQKLKADQHIALWMARDNLPGAYDMLVGLAPAAQSDEVLRWRARCSLRETNWVRLLLDINAMQGAERNTEEWRYWLAIAQIETGNADVAAEDLNALSGERSFYGFLAADKLGRAYALDHASLSADQARQQQLESRTDVVRARELFYVGQDSRGRSEWGAVMRRLSKEDKLQAALLADSWGWHSRAIAAAASVAEYDDLTLRYPLPHQETFKTTSSRASISPTWAYGIARSESLFMRDVRSSAGAVGLMQLMPATGRDVAKDINLSYSGVATLVDPESNILLGTTYLGQMANRYDGNPIPATAAYNAGPGRVDQWLPKQGEVDARVWIENIPFNETRKYVKRVLTAQTIFHWRMTGKVQRISDQLPVVRSPLADKRASAN